MDYRLAAAEAALKAGRSAEAVEQIEAALAESSRRPAQVYRVLVRNLYRLRRFTKARRLRRRFGTAPERRRAVEFKRRDAAKSWPLRRGALCIGHGRQKCTS